MIGAGISYYGAQGENYLAGNAKIYDGSFDYDIISSFSQLDRTDAFSIMFDLNLSIISGFRAIFVQGASNGVGGGMFALLNGTQLLFRLERVAGSSLQVVYNSFANIGRQNIAVTYDGTSTAAGVKVYKDGVFVAQSSSSNSLSGSIINATYPQITIGSGFPVSSFLGAKLKIFEIINRVATAGEVLLAAQTGSFRGANIPFSSGLYRLAVNTNQTGTANLTTFASTPTYTITAFGGAAYTPYL